jgi:hypothetical protein
MDAASLALGAIVLIKPIAETVYETWTSAHNFGQDSERFRVRFAMQKTRLESFERVLFDVDKLVPGMLFDRLPDQVRQIVVELLRQLYGILYEYVVLKKRWELENRTENVLVDKSAHMSSEERMAALVVGGQARDEEQGKSVSWIKKTWWALWEKKNTEKMVAEFEAWTERVRVLLELAWWPLPFFSTVSQLNKLEKDEDAKEVGLLSSIALRKLLIRPDLASEVKVLRIGKSQFQLESSVQEFDLGHISTTKVMVEYKDYGKGQSGGIDDISSKRITQLVALLHEAKDRRFKLARCLFYFDDVAKSRIGLAFEQVSPQPTTLFTVLASRIQPSLDIRIKLAFALAESVQLLHSVGWVHKSLRSSNVVFADLGSFDEPRIFGFDYSRAESDFSAGDEDYEVLRNLYRHPARSGKPSESFSTIHDIYGYNYLDSLLRINS